MLWLWYNGFVILLNEFIRYSRTQLECWETPAELCLLIYFLNRFLINSQTKITIWNVLYLIPMSISQRTQNKFRTAFYYRRPRLIDYMTSSSNTHTQTKTQKPETVIDFIWINQIRPKYTKMPCRTFLVGFCLDLLLMFIGFHLAAIIKSYHKLNMPISFIHKMRF